MLSDNSQHISCAVSALQPQADGLGYIMLRPGPRPTAAAADLAALMLLLLLLLKAF
jgi:hypothetical protein